MSAKSDSIGPNSQNLSEFEKTGSVETSRTSAMTLSNFGSKEIEKSFVRIHFKKETTEFAEVCK